MKFKPQMSVLEAIALSKHTLVVFYKYGIDVCCGSHLTLAQASQKAGVPLSTLLKELEQVVNNKC
jgi:iron-sulfur cluster repair protein YtfE (RIC family)